MKRSKGIDKDGRAYVESTDAWVVIRFFLLVTVPVAAAAFVVRALLACAGVI